MISSRTGSKRHPLDDVGVIGPLVGGLITEHIQWSWIFFVNVPVGLLGVVVARIVIGESRDT